LKHKYNLSVIIPAHNEEKNIGVALDSLAELRRNYPNTQVICGLDGCDDHTKEIMKRYEFVEHFEFHQRQGKHIVIDELMKMVKNDIVVICDADRRFVCGRGELEKLLECFEDPEVGGVGDYYTTTYDDEKVRTSNDLLFLGDAWNTLLILEYKMRNFADRKCGKLYVSDRGFMFFVNFFRRDAFKNFHTKTLCDDGERLIFLMNNGYKVRLLETEQKPYLKAIYSEMDWRGFLRTKIRGMIAQRQIDEMYGQFSVNPGLGLFWHILKNLRRVDRKRALAGILLWWSIVVLARVRYALMLNKNINTRTGWSMRMG